MSYKQKVRDINEQLFNSTGLRKEGFAEYKQRLESRPSFEDYVFPHKLNATELKIKSDIAKIVSVTSSFESASDFVAFDIDKIRPLLTLAVPKKVIEYSGPDTYDAQDPFAKIKPGKAPRNSSSSNKRGLKQQRAQEAASIYDDDDDTRPSSGKKQRTSLLSSTADSSSTTTTTTTNTTTVKKQSIKVEAKQKLAAESLMQTILPTNFHTLVRPFFEEFWKLEFDNTEVTWAFFAKITDVNCAEYKLSTFAEQSSSLAVIKERLDGVAYSTVGEFERDFQALFENIFRFYPAGHPAYLKAVELFHFFERRWKDIMRDFTFS